MHLCLRRGPPALQESDSVSRCRWVFLQADGSIRPSVHLPAPSHPLLVPVSICWGQDTRTPARESPGLIPGREDPGTGSPAILIVVSKQNPTLHHGTPPIAPCVLQWPMFHSWLKKDRTSSSVIYPAESFKTREPPS